MVQPQYTRLTYSMSRIANQTSHHSSGKIHCEKSNSVVEGDTFGNAGILSADLGLGVEKNMRVSYNDHG